MPSFDSDPARSLEGEIKSYILGSPQNCLKDVDGSAIFEEPLVGFANGDDSLFQDYKRVVGDFHLTPREALCLSSPEGPGHASEPRHVSVVSWILPIGKETRLANRKMTEGPSRHWNNVRWLGQELNDNLARHVVQLLEHKGYRAVAPDQTPAFEVRHLSNGRASNWSQRHVAYAAGLGTFSLSDGLITARGIAMRCNSVVTDLELPATPRRYSSHVANCPFFVDGSCGACIKRCPAGAITHKGHDKVKCSEMMQVFHKLYLTKPGYLGRYAACGLCQTKVPCESRIPKLASAPGGSPAARAGV
ncbi:MAG: epoxyqueuosine reductase [Chloroflexi bacterium]|nr:epoxyqueuosine reductase [Chloroflexota bacterium]